MTEKKKRARKPPPWMNRNAYRPADQKKIAAYLKMWELSKANA